MWALYWVYGSCFRKDLVSIVVSQSILSIKWSFFFLAFPNLNSSSLGFILFLLPSFNLCSTVRIVFAYFYFPCNLSRDWILCNRMETLCDWKDGLYFTLLRWNLKPKCSAFLVFVHTHTFSLLIFFHRSRYMRTEPSGSCKQCHLPRA